jgi:hypothetical protein
MQYKTIVLELLQQQTELHEQLRLTRRLFPTMEALAKDLRARHETWKQELLAIHPNSEPAQISSEAMEMALSELEKHLHSESPQDVTEPLSLDQAMAYIQKHSLRE